MMVKRKQNINLKEKQYQILIYPMKVLLKFLNIIVKENFMINLKFTCVLMKDINITPKSTIKYQQNPATRCLGVIIPGN